MKTLSKTLSFCAAIMLYCTCAAFAGDSTSFDPTKIPVKAKGGGGVPVGTVIAWPVATNPEDMDNWLECNGQSISPTAFPELYALVGGAVPDFRGLFLRGTGGNAASLGQVQQDAGRNATGTFNSADDNRPEPAFHPEWVTGAFTSIISSVGSVPAGGPDNHAESIVYFDLSRVWGAEHTAAEFRPVNTAVRYLIRALP
jgi:hypothetical protein